MIEIKRGTSGDMLELWNGTESEFDEKLTVDSRKSGWRRTRRAIVG